ncbi:MAG: glycerophosphodiester phosphodiesterase [Phycisphaerae bacterium]
MIIAHRGASAIAPENTKAAFLLAWQMKTPVAECDIHLTADNQIVVMHDSNTKRTCGVDVNISDVNYSEISSLDAGSFKDAKYSGERIPLLADVIGTIPPDKKLLVEIKCGREVLPFLQDAINKSGKRNQIVIIGFNIDIIAEAKILMPDIPVYWLVMTEKDKTDKWILHSSELITTAKKRHLDGIDVHWAGLSKEFVQKAHKAGMKVYTWTVDDLPVARQVKKMRVDGITSNKPDLLRKNI